MTKYDYFYNLEGDGYGFLSVPKLFFTHEFYQELSVEAKILYGFMLELMKTSQEQQWQDEKNRNYIVLPVVDAMKMLGVGRSTIQRIMGELVKIGLIEKKKRGLGKPDLIYIRRFDSIVEEWEEDSSQENKIIPLVNQGKGGDI